MTTTDFNFESEFAKAALPLNLYVLRQHENRGWDTYDSCVVCAIDENSARQIHPDSGALTNDTYSGWVTAHTAYYNPDAIQVELIGTAAPGITAGTVLCASFNAG